MVQVPEDSGHPYNHVPSDEPASLYKFVVGYQLDLTTRAPRKEAALTSNLRTANSRA